MTTSAKQIAVIGAGLSGAVLAHDLTNAGFQVTVFEKSRGTGGRMCSMRNDTLAADLGVPFMSPREPAFKQWLDNYPCISRFKLTSRGFSDAAVHHSHYYCASPRQSALTRHLLNNITLIPNTRVASLCPEKINNASHILLRNDQGKSLGLFYSVVVAAPARQAMKLLDAVPEFSRTAATVECLSNWVMVVTIQALKTTPFDQLSGTDPILSRCVKDSIKPERVIQEGQETWLLEANSEWSHTHIDADHQWVSDQLYAHFVKYLGYNPSIVAHRSHRWLYSRHKSVNNRVLWDSETRIGACGDWLHEGGIEGAWFSAKAIGNRISKAISPST